MENFIYAYNLYHVGYVSKLFTVIVQYKAAIKNF